MRVAVLIAVLKSGGSREVWGRGPQKHLQQCPRYKVHGENRVLLQITEKQKIIVAESGEILLSPLH